MKDKHTNANYHVAGFTPRAVSAFKKYLFYNGSIHVRNIVYAVIYAVLRVIFGQRLIGFDWLVLIHSVKDIYCVMLQRYNFLQIKNFQLSHEFKRQERTIQEAAQLRNHFQENYMFSNREHDLRVLMELKQSLKQNEIILIDRELAETLNRLEGASKRMYERGQPHHSGAENDYGKLPNR